MGNDSKNSPDVSKAPPRAAYVLAGAASNVVVVDGGVQEEIVQAAGSTATKGGGQASGPIDFCVRVHDLDVELFDSAAAFVGQTVRLLVGRPPRVMDVSGQQIGTVSDPQESAIAHCLIDGYEMSGEIIVIDDEHATIRIAGERRPDDD